MPADQDVYRKVGRGGAGNYYAPPTDGNDSKDLEAQALGTSVAPTPDRSNAQVPTRAGRGGAGNYVDPANMPDAREQEEMAKKTAAAVNASLKRHSQAHGGQSGRGGAGNWKTDEDEERKKLADEESALGVQLEKQVKEAVDKGLKMPDKVHHHVV
ncbi:hypothetical protein BGZ61DRAFT_26067 [Ilyonectria robusta]|uniref:uncharacterized protein n=1 Tax=Ilyonectria robusta TaxID=1079257 RepID=UPI001E8ED677|nr:uncharacterized protein BGZ61DRAFT_26067 [Ilyonectria robusta]KAH6998755.1 hypothetical protein BKA56DRAFT_34338 [Ilyonectria sp. MPI-CAGE-AT-0026]KAH8737990.1 hypothetical protein BGZ61DRAFT_26067 [Ilyonectria robusta]